MAGARFGRLGAGWLAALPALACAAAQPVANPAPDAARAVAAAAAVEQGLAERRVVLARAVLDAERAEATAAAAATATQADAVAAHAAAAAAAETLRPLWPIARRLALWPAETLLAAPVPPAEALLGLAMLQIQGQRLGAAAAAAREAAGIAARRAAAAAERAAALDAAEAIGREAVTRLDAELAAARARRIGAQDAEAIAATLAALVASRARTLEAAVERVARPVPTEPSRGVPASRDAGPAAPIDPPTPRAAAALSPGGQSGPEHAPGRPHGMLPVAGRVLRGFGEPTADGRAQGLTIATAPGARVVAPCAGRVAFAGPFRSYGQMAIIACVDAAHVVLAGLGRIDVPIGGRVLAGEPLGVLARDPSAGGTLYLELRRNGAAVDPRPWLAGLR